MSYTNKEIEEKTKDYILHEYEWVKNPYIYNRSTTIVNAIHRSYGIFLFVSNILLPDENENLISWWEDEMLPKFNGLL